MIEKLHLSEKEVAENNIIVETITLLKQKIISSNKTTIETLLDLTAKVIL